MLDKNLMIGENGLKFCGTVVPQCRIHPAHPARKRNGVFSSGTWNRISIPVGEIREWSEHDEKSKADQFDFPWGRSSDQHVRRVGPGQRYFQENRAQQEHGSPSPQIS